MLANLLQINLLSLSDLLLNQCPPLFVVVLFAKWQIQDYYTHKALKGKWKTRPMVCSYLKT